MIRRARSNAVLATLAAGLLGVFSSTQTWVQVTLADGTAGLAVTGADAVPVLAPLSLAVLALGAALSIVGHVVRIVLGALMLLIAVALVTLSAPVLTGPPASAYAAVVTEATGIGGDQALAGLVAATTVTGWPVIAILAGVLLAAAGGFVVATSHRWPRGGRKYQSAALRAPQEGPLDAIDSWDELSRGDDPTAGTRS